MPFHRRLRRPRNVPSRSPSLLLRCDRLRPYQDLVNRQSAGTHTALVTAAVHCASMRTRGLRRTYSAPIPFGRRFCDRRMTSGQLSTGSGRRQFAHALGCINVIDNAASTAISPIAAISCTTPISLFTCMKKRGWCRHASLLQVLSGR